MHQGRLVAGHRTNPIAVATGARTGVLAVVAFALTTTPAGAWLGAAAFTAGLAAEALIVTFAPAPTPTPAPNPAPAPRRHCSGRGNVAHSLTLGVVHAFGVRPHSLTLGVWC